MAAFAEVSDLIARWRELNEPETARAKVLLADAAMVIEEEGADVKTLKDKKPELLKMVSCDMVKRAMLASVDQPAATQGSMTVGPFSGSLTYANPTGDLYLTKKEKRRLGIGLQRVGFAHPWGDA